MLKQQIQTDAKDALKSGDQFSLGVLRMALSVINLKEKDKRYKISKEDSEIKENELMQSSTLNDDEIVTVLFSEIKKRKDAMALYQQGNRQELVDNEQKEISVLQKYLPEQLLENELKKIIEESIGKTGATTIKDMGKIMADLMPKIKGKADNSQVSRIIKSMLS